MAKSKWIYINETEYNLSYFPPELYVEFNLQPFDTIVFEDRSEGMKDTKASDYNPRLSPYIIYYGNSLCDTLLKGPGPRNGEGPYGINNYESKKLDDNYFEFTYRFTNTDVAKADTCK